MVVGENVCFQDGPIIDLCSDWVDFRPNQRIHSKTITMATPIQPGSAITDAEASVSFSSALRTRTQDLHTFIPRRHLLSPQLQNHPPSESLGLAGIFPQSTFYFLPYSNPSPPDSPNQELHPGCHDVADTSGTYPKTLDQPYPLMLFQRLQTGSTLFCAPLPPSSRGGFKFPCDLGVSEI